MEAGTIFSAFLLKVGFEKCASKYCFLNEDSFEKIVLLLGSGILETIDQDAGDLNNK
jgi:hypothetical protein